MNMQSHMEFISIINFSKTSQKHAKSEHSAGRPGTVWTMHPGKWKPQKLSFCMHISINLEHSAIKKMAEMGSEALFIPLNSKSAMGKREPKKPSRMLKPSINLL